MPAVMSFLASARPDSASTTRSPDGKLWPDPWPKPPPLPLLKPSLPPPPKLGPRKPWPSPPSSVRCCDGGRGGWPCATCALCTQRRAACAASSSLVGWAPLIHGASAAPLASDPVPKPLQPPGPWPRLGLNGGGLGGGSGRSSQASLLRSKRASIREADACTWPTPAPGPGSPLPLPRPGAPRVLVVAETAPG